MKYKSLTKQTLINTFMITKVCLVDVIIYASSLSNINSIKSSVLTSPK